MPIDPAVVGGVAIAVAVALAAGYSYVTGNESSVDMDSDGNDEVTFGGDDTFETEEDEEEESQLDNMFVPDEVANVESLTDVTGIGATRAEDLKASGFHTAVDLYFAADEELKNVHGIGDLTVSQIRDDIGQTGE